MSVPTAFPVSSHPGGICAVIVSYAPDRALLHRVLESARRQVDHVVLFDNGSPLDATEPGLETLADAAVTIVVSPRNVGLGAALNRACDRARALGFGHVLLMDQDSVLDEGMVRHLSVALLELGRDHPVAAVGPQFKDARNGAVAPFVRIGFPLNRKLYGGPGARVACDFLITSGSLIPMAVLDRVGGMDETLFIDNIDMDWCFRAAAAGFLLYGVCDAQMRHRIGEQLRPSRIKRDGVIVHKPFRLYYIMRNRVLLYPRAQTPAVWVAQDLPRLVLKFLGNALFIAPRGERLVFMLRGLWDAVRGRSGPMP